jgi:diguanylate cyclase (GGDEF)-like protein
VPESTLLHHQMRKLIMARRLLIGLGSSVVCAVFTVLALSEHAGPSLGNYLYLAIALFALGSGPLVGVLAGVSCGGLLTLGVVLNPELALSDLSFSATAVPLAMYVLAGGVTGLFAKSQRDLLQDLEILAERDHLTGVMNVRAFESELARRVRVGQPFALLLADMDDLKQINDEMGHAEGNAALAGLGGSLERLLRRGDQVARIGGDEFAIIASLSTVADASALALRLESVLYADGLRVSFGWAVFPDEGSDQSTLYQRADEFLYARKRARKAHFGDILHLGVVDGA